MKQTNRQTVTCPQCDGNVRVRKVTQLGQLITCRYCHVKLEVVSLTPLELDWATQLQFQERIDNKRHKNKKRRRQSKAFEKQWNYY